MTNDSDDTAAKASIGDVSGYADRVDAQVREVLGRVLAQRRSAGTAFAYVAGLAPGVKANCWALAEAAGYESPYRMQALLGSYRWGWRELRAELPALAREWLPCDPGDLIGPGLAFDETAQLKDGDATACVAPQHAGCTGHVENCVTTVFAAYVTTSGQAWADFDVFMPGRWEKDLPRRRAAGIPGKLERAAKPQLAIGQLERLLKAGLPARWAAFDEVYGRSSALRGACQAAGLPYAAVIPRDFRITLPSGAVIKAEGAVRDAVFERRSCGNGSKGPRYADWALAATASPRHVLLIRRLISRPDSLTFYLCWAPEDQPVTMTFFVTIAGRRWPCEEDPAGLFATRCGASPTVPCGWLMIFVRSPSPRLAAEWCGHVDAAAAVAGCSRAHRESRAVVVPERESGDADPRGAGRGVRRYAVRRCVRGAGPAGDLPGPADDGQRAAVHREPDGPAGC
ncbi:MAG TPA: transposase [Streptosporangiaceae bacterium]